MPYSIIHKWPIPSIFNMKGHIQLNQHFSFQDYPETLFRKWMDDSVIEKLINVNNVIVYVGNLKLGDYIMLNPFLNSLRKALPTSNIKLMANPVPPARTLIEDEGLVDSIFEVKSMKHRLWSFSEYIRWGRVKAANENIDLLIDTQRQFLPSLALKGVLSPQKVIGYSTGSLFSDWKIDESGRNNVHATFQIAILLRRLGIRMVYPLHLLPVSPAVNDVVEKYFRKNNLTRTIALFPFTAERDDLKLWPLKYFMELATLLIRKGYSVMLMGSGSEMKELRKIRSDIGKGAFLSDPEEFGVSPRDSIYLSMACLQNCELSFSCMSGGGHLAAALGVRTLVFAPYERLHKFAPLGPNVWSLYTDISCTPCKVRGRLPCKGERWCVHAISPEIAAEAILYCISLPKNESLVSDTQGSVRSC